jgi:aminoglycoside phosphotransferase (APT) family kinase protein
MPEWDPEVAIDEALVRKLLEEQFPELDAESARLLGEGWDNSVWVVEEQWAFRFPRRRIAIPGVERELAVLPRLAPLLPVPIPEPRFVGRPSELFRWPFFGAPLLPGVEPAEAELEESDRVNLGAALGRFLRALHAPDTLAAVDPERALPVDFNRRADMPFRVARAREKLSALPVDVWRAPASVERILSDAEDLPDPSGIEVVTHGDLHIRHLLVEGGAIAGVIDWGDVCRANPAIDLMLVWMLLSPAGRERFAMAYGSIDAEQLVRSRVLALFLGVTLAHYARDIGHTALERACVSALERTLVE